MKKLIMFIFIIAALSACKPSPRSNCPLNWNYCQVAGECLDGDYIYVCIDTNSNSGGYRIGNRCFVCANAADAEYGGCDSAAHQAVDYCQPVEIYNRIADIEGSDSDTADIMKLLMEELAWTIR